MIKQASPGNLQDVEEDFAGQIESAPVILAVKIQHKAEVRTVGVSFADASVRELGISEFVDNDLYSNLEVRSSRDTPQPSIISRTFLSSRSLPLGSC